MVNFYHLSLRLGALLLATLPAFSIVSAKDDNSNKKDNGNKEESNRNVMLNAASANGPREIQIGLPSADVNVLENGLPVTYATNPRSVNSLWRGEFEPSGLIEDSRDSYYNWQYRLCGQLFHAVGTGWFSRNT